MSLQTTAVPAAAASSTVSPKASLRDMLTKTLAARKRWARSSSVTRPMNSTRSTTPVSMAVAWICSRAGPSPNTTSRKVRCQVLNRPDHDLDLLVSLDSPAGQNGLAVGGRPARRRRGRASVDAVLDDPGRPAGAEVAGDKRTFGFGAAHDERRPSDHPGAQDAVWTMKESARVRMTRAVVMRCHDERDAVQPAGDRADEGKRCVVRVGVDEVEPAGLAEQPDRQPR